jgi:uncharacterized delta-60 repeat protein
MNKYIILTLSIFAVILLANAINAQNTIPDSLFGFNSNLVVQSQGSEARGGSLLRQPDGKLIFGAYETGTENDFLIDMVRFDECGKVDSLFGTNGLVRYKFDQRNLGYAFALQPDGNILCAGVQAPSNAGSQQHAFVSRFNSDGTPDSTFNETGTHFLGGTGAFHSVYTMNDGRIVCFGQLSTATGAAVVIFLPDGSLDTSFNGDGIASFHPSAFSYFTSTKGYLLPDGKFLLTSYASDAINAYHFLAVRFDSLGMVDTSYATAGYYYDNVVSVNGYNHPFSSALDANGNLLMSQSTDNTSVDILRLTPDGILDPSFGSGGHVHYNYNGTAGGIDALPDGKILIRGKFSISYGIGCGIRLLADGNPDETFGLDGLRQFDLNNSSGTHWLDALFVLPNGQWIAAGASSGFLFKKYGEVSNFPHIMQTGGVLNSTGMGSFQWYLNGEPIPSATQNSYAFTQNGNYNVMITDVNGCTATSSAFSMINAAVSDYTFVGDVIIYPNPSSGKYYFKAVNNNSLLLEVEVRNSLGQIVFAKTDFTFSDVVDLGNKGQGIYLIQIKNGSKVQSFKVLQQ